MNAMANYIIIIIAVYIASIANTMDGKVW